MWGSPLSARLRQWSRRDPAQARFLTVDSLRWVVRNRAWTPWYLVRYWRLLKFRLRNPHIVLRGMVFLGKDVEIHARPGFGRMEIGRWVHIGDGNAIRTLVAAYGSELVLLAVAEQDVAGKRLNVTLTGRDAVGAFLLKRTYRLDAATQGRVKMTFGKSKHPMRVDMEKIIGKAPPVCVQVYQSEPVAAENRAYFVDS